MRDEDPKSWQDAIAFDHAIRQADANGQRNRQKLVGLPFVHDTLIPLDMVNLDEDDGKVGAGCGITTDKSGINDGMFAGMCGV